MFVGRINEINKIKNFLKTKGALIAFGLRRVGKTTLIKKVLTENKIKYVYFECQKTTEKNNVDLFVDMLKEEIGFIDAKFDSFLPVFKILNSSYKDYVFVIDEYSYLKQYYLDSRKSENKDIAEKLDSEFQNIIDNYLTNINLIISGSSINIMGSLLDHKSPFYGRFKEIIRLKQLPYNEAQEMFKELSYRDFIALYSVFGGSPYALEKYNKSLTLKENICDLIIKEDGILRNHLNNNVINELNLYSDLNEILNALKNGMKKYSEIQDLCHITTSGLLDKYLKKLLELDIIEVKFPIGKEDKKKKFYQIKDNLLKFYYAYIFRNENKINLLGEERYYDVYISKSIDHFISRRFENIVRDYFSFIIKKGERKDIIDIGCYFTDNNEFDCVFKKKDNTFGVYEAKFTKKPLTISVINKEIEQVKQIKRLKISEIGFISANGFENKKTPVKYLDLKDLFNTY